MIDRLIFFLLENWDKILPHLRRPHKLRFMVAKGSLGGYAGKVNFFLFADNDNDPAVIAKTVRDPQYDRLLTVEYDSLKYIHSNFSNPLNEKAPRALFLGQIANYKILIEEALTGKSVDAIVTGSLFNRKRLSYHMLNIISDWLIEFKRRSVIKENYHINDSDQRESFYEPIESFLRLYNISEKEKEFLEDMENKIADIVKNKYPLVFEHGDLSPINIIFSKVGDKFWVIDWSCAKIRGLPFCDLFFLLTCFPFCSCPHEFEGIVRLNNFAQIFLRNGEYSDISSKLITDYCHKLNIDLSFVQTFFAMFIISRANNEYDILMKQANRGYIPVIRPFDQGKDYRDGGLLKSGVYINLFHKFVEASDQFIF